MRGHRGQWLEDVRHGTEGVLGRGLGCLRQEALLGADGTELEVLPVHGDVGCQGLQVQLIEVRLRGDRPQAKQLQQLALPPGYCSILAPHAPHPTPARGLPPAASPACSPLVSLCHQIPSHLSLHSAILAHPTRCHDLHPAPNALLSPSPSPAFTPTRWAGTTSSTKPPLPTPVSTMAPRGPRAALSSSPHVPRVYRWVAVAQCYLWDLHSDQQGLRRGPAGSHYHDGHRREFSQADAEK